MPIRFVPILTAFIFFMTAFAPLPSLKEVTYRETSGPVSPKGYWQEKYAVSSTGLTFVREGHPTVTMVNTGNWKINNYGESETKLFTDLSDPEVYNVEQIGQGPAPSGGGLKVYTVGYDNGDTRKVIIGDGRLYKNAALITTPINNYIATVKLPEDASNRYK